MVHKFKTSMHRKRSPAMTFTYTKTDQAGNKTIHKHKTKTQQHLQKSTDVNYIVARCTQTNVPLPTNTAPNYEDYSKVPDYKAAMNLTIIANERFALLPAEIRSKFRNDPTEMLEFVHNPDNKEECEKLGLLPQPPAKIKQVVKTETETEVEPEADNAPEKPTEQ